MNELTRMGTREMSKPRVAAVSWTTGAFMGGAFVFFFHALVVMMLVCAGVGVTLYAAYLLLKG